METRDKYRFTLQWGSDTAEKVQAGEFLKRFGNRKSELIVMAISEYLRSRPELLPSAHNLKIVVKPIISQDQLKALVRDMIDERLTGAAPVLRADSTSGNVDSVIGDDLDEMINNLDLFS